MNADAFFAIGKTHKVCQDYARAGVTKCGPYALLSDGCSSSPDTDIGSRILVNTAEKLAQQGFCFNKSWGLDLYRGDARDTLNQMSLPLETLDATLLSSTWRPAFKTFQVDIAGDGVVAARRRDGSGFDLWVVEYPSGAPHYPSYLLHPERHDDYLEKFGTRYIFRHRTPDGEWTSKDGGRTDVSPVSDIWPTFMVSSNAYDLLVLMSDGAQSFQRMTNTGTSLVPEKVPVEDVVAQVMAVKGTQGEFLVRRCQRFLGRFCAKHGWFHTDDFSAAAIWMGDPK